MTNLDRWLKRFRHGAAVAYHWAIVWQRTHQGPRRRLRACDQAGLSLKLDSEACPLTMQQHLDGFPSMLGAHMLVIMAAADDAPEANRTLQAQLWRMCQVGEPRR